MLRVTCYVYDINITIVNYKNKDDLSVCLKSLFSDIKNSNLKIIVHIVDNSQNVDGIKEFLNINYPVETERYPVHYIDPGDNIGFGKANNLGFGKAKAKFYLALNPDIEFTETHTLKKMIDFLNKNAKIGIVGPKLLNLDGSIQNSCYRFPKLFDQFYRRLNFKIKYFQRKVDNYLMGDFNHNKNIPVDWIMGAFMLAKSELTDKIGFFDDRFFMYFEDCDWCRRIKQAGYQVYYLSNIIARHRHKRDSAQDKHPFLSILTNPMSRIHLKSWLKYFLKWNFINSKCKNQNAKCNIKF